MGSVWKQSSTQEGSFYLVTCAVCWLDGFIGAVPPSTAKLGAVPPFQIVCLQRYKNYGFNAVNFYQGVSKKYLLDPDTKRDIDISFVGGMDRPGRSELFSLLSEKGYSVSLFGYGTKNGYITSRKMMEIYGLQQLMILH